ncbi:acyl-CoA dehydrogenase family protein [Haladaptatus halobius]|uniref:acyl-CoA dehydrogenase family protein n=1 Tax=Haladaptatus halobius TaxID=2884875 RepID=UPI001D0ACDCE|nr:acyl-CoA dehydrogenase family protein [Haladaptatus halobius]
MDLEFSNQTKMLRREIRRFVDDEFRPILNDLPDKIERYHDLDPENPELTDDVRPHPIKIPEEDRKRLRAKAKEVGFWAMGVPEQYGGGGLNLLERCVVLEELSKHRMGLYQPGIGVIELGPGLTVGEPSAYLNNANEDQIDRFFQPCIDGDKQSCFALTEPAAGSDPRGMETRAEKEGDEWVINGTKHYISWAGDADFLILFARTEPKNDGINEHGITTFLVPADSDGVSMRSIPVIRPEYPFEVTLKDVRVPDENVLGDIGQGLSIAKECLGESRVLYAANCLGPIDQSIRMGIDWANDRQVGGQPLADRQAIQWKIAKSAVDYQAAKYSVYHAAWKFDQGEDIRHEASVTKYQASETLWTVLDRMVQIHGGAGVDADLPLERWLREARVRRIGEGPTEIHLKTIARNLLKGYEDPDPIPLD